MQSHNCIPENLYNEKIKTMFIENIDRKIKIFVYRKIL